MGKPKTEKMIYKRFGFEVKSLTEDEKFHYFDGYLSVYGNIDMAGEVMDEGCFDESIKQLTPMLLWQHIKHEVIGVFVEFRSDTTGLFVRGKMPKTDTLVTGRVFPQMEVGSVRHMSVGFIPGQYEYTDGVKHHQKVMLVEGSLVAMAANQDARIFNMKSFGIEDVDGITKRDFETMLRDSGLSNKAATYLASRLKDDEQGEPVEVKSMSKEIKTLNEQLKGLLK